MNSGEYTLLKNYRFELKHAAERYKENDILLFLRIHPAGFYEIFQERFINNIYFDTTRLDFFYDNILGRPDRIKVRVRWYGDMLQNIKSPVLEIKKKKGLVGIKESFFLDPFDFSSVENVKVFREFLLDNKLPDNIKELVKQLHPVLLNRYRRRYFRDFMNVVRVTIDKDLEYGKLLGAFESYKEHNKVVLELKYDNDKNPDVKRILKGFPFRITKNSKYVTGVQAFYDIID